MKRRYFLFAVIFAISLGAVEVGDANPIYLGEVPPDDFTNPPVITILSPQNNSSYNTTNISFGLGVRVGESKTATSSVIDTITYKTDWESGIFTVFTTEMFKDQLSINKSHNPINYFSETFNISDVPAGNHIITVYATVRGNYVNASQQLPAPYESLSPYHSFTIKNSASACFLIDLLDSPNPIANQSMPTINTGPTLPVGFNPPIVLITIAVVIVIAAVASIVLVYFKKHKSNAFRILSQPRNNAFNLILKPECCFHSKINSRASFWKTGCKGFFWIDLR